jgi:hypothetical protein
MEKAKKNTPKPEKIKKTYYIDPDINKKLTEECNKLIPKCSESALIESFVINFLKEKKRI